MRLKKLIIDNIASIEHAEIDFDAAPLAGEHLFLITGETGSGKTTIIDCLCLALYGDTPRLSATKGSSYTPSRQEGGNAESLKTDDVRQLLRRGAVSADVHLTFEDDHGMAYVATWHVHRAHRKLENGIMKPERTLRSDTPGLVLHLEGPKEINPYVAELIGLDMNQFLRTVVLAQGKFSEFLNSGESEKADLLEKMTGTEIYAQLGVKIYQTYKQKENERNLLREQLQNITLLGDDEKEQIGSEINRLKTQLGALQQQRDIALKMTEWLAEKSLNDKDLADKQKSLADKQDKTHQQDYQEQSAIIIDWDTTADARQELKSQQEAERLLKDIMQQQPQLQGEFERLSTALQTAANDLKRQQQEYNSLHVEQTIAHKDELTTAKHDLIAYKNAREAITLARQSLEKSRHDLQEQQLTLQKALASIDDKRALMEKSRAAVDRQKDWNALIEQALRTLHQGDRCPVCGNVIDTLLAPKAQTELDQLQDDFNRAQKTVINAEADIHAAQKLIQRLTAQIQQDSQALAAKDRETQLLWKRLQATLPQCAISIEENTPSAVLQSHINSMAEEADRLSIAIKRGQDLNKSIQQGHDKLNKAQHKLQDIENKRLQCNTLIENYQRQIHQAKQAIAAFLDTHPTLSLERLTMLADVGQANIQAIKQAHHNLTQAITLLQGEVSALSKHREELEAKRPPLDIQDTEHLAAIIGETQEKIETLNDTLSSLAAQLKADAERVLQAEEKKKALAQIESAYTQWSHLNNMLGDHNGNKFRKIAQSYILDELLHNANGYLHQFNNRYELEAKPGTLVILVRDLLQGDLTSVGTLSGGESFMVSLALALALSNTTGKMFSVDTLFIDEGFGSLSPNYLDNVMDTLNRLYELGGRRVGIISHVEMLKERVTTQIRVERDAKNNTVSRVTTVS